MRKSEEEIKLRHEKIEELMFKNDGAMTQNKLIASLLEDNISISQPTIANDLKELGYVYDNSNSVYKRSENNSPFALSEIFKQELNHLNISFDLNFNKIDPIFIRTTDNDYIEYLEKRIKTFIYLSINAKDTEDYHTVKGSGLLIIYVFNKEVHSKIKKILGSLI
ncbi:hypothetical protein JCM19047_686 [Bacillus sp. JCM 19047]|uniref:Arginine repressor DNA-binding domain-containing protein n=1 Tax=Shouchella miscanthi TaxID=2598861 RepID=A0ABU6NRE5_9BACI|nr:hypothetical protein [Shouchella miscanthi]MED4130746.1 hypothetical protein [Shouchella miscanthi]GAF21019.1 hypothetical protein JCM19047_686 [Bacillus sp. JCM 19047]